MLCKRGDSCVEKGSEEAAFPTGSLLLLDKEAQPCNLPACFWLSRGQKGLGAWASEANPRRKHELSPMRQVPPDISSTTELRNCWPSCVNLAHTECLLFGGKPKAGCCTPNKAEWAIWVNLCSRGVKREAHPWSATVGYLSVHFTVYPVQGRVQGLAVWALRQLSKGLGWGNSAWLLW